MCLNNIGNTGRLLGGGVEISYVETMNGERGQRVVHGLHNVVIITVVSGCRAGPVMVHTGHKTANLSLLKQKI